MNSKYLIIIALFVVLYSSTVFSFEKVLMRDIKVLVFNKGAYTIGRHNSRIPQLNYIGGNGKAHIHKVNSIQCRNHGYDGRDIIWDCAADIAEDNDYKIILGKRYISCEGYEYPGDPYILNESCNIEYLLHVELLHEHSGYGWYMFIGIIIGGIIIIGGLLIYSYTRSRTRRHNSRYNSHNYELPQHVFIEGLHHRSNRNL